MIWPILSLVIIIVGVIVISIVHYYDKKIVALIKEYNRRDHKVNSLLVDYLSNIKTLITLRFLQPTQDVLDRSIAHTRSPFYEQVSYNEIKRFAADVILRSALGIVIFLYIYYSWSATGTVIIGTIMMIYQYVERVSNSFYNVTSSYSQIVQAASNTAAVQNIIDDYKQLPPQPHHTQLHHWDTIEINHLSFHYTDHKNTLSDISLRITKGQKVALVWESGSGKSTLLSLLRGIYHADTVQVSIDQVSYDNLTPLYQQTSLIPQEPELFEESIAFNITMGLDVWQETLEKYAQLACFHETAIELPQWYQSNIKEKWVNLSWGQKQRLALARGLLSSQDSTILLLDESTSSVDSINEKKIYNNIFKEFQDKTIIATIHKLHLLPLFDQIYVFDKGEVIESGSFHNLIAQWGIFTTLRNNYQSTQRKSKQPKL